MCFGFGLLAPFLKHAVFMPAVRAANRLLSDIPVFHSPALCFTGVFPGHTLALSVFAYLAYNLKTRHQISRPIWKPSYKFPNQEICSELRKFAFLTSSYELEAMSLRTQFYNQCCRAAWGQCPVLTEAEAGVI